MVGASAYRSVSTRLRSGREAIVRRSHLEAEHAATYDPDRTASTVFPNVAYRCWPGVFPVGQETGAAWAGGAAVQGLGRSCALTPAGNMNSATGVTGRLA